jgi:hypothetical protein
MMDGKVNDKVAAKIIGLATQTLANWRHLRKGPKYIKMGRSVRYDLLDLIEFMKMHTIDPEQFTDAK